MKFVAKGKFIGYEGNALEPTALVLEIHDNEGKLFENEKMMIVGKRFATQLMKALTYTYASRLVSTGAKVKILIELHK